MMCVKCQSKSSATAFLGAKVRQTLGTSAKCRRMRCVINATVHTESAGIKKQDLHGGCVVALEDGSCALCDQLEHDAAASTRKDLPSSVATLWPHSAVVFLWKSIAGMLEYCGSVQAMSLVFAGTPSSTVRNLVTLSSSTPCSMVKWTSGSLFPTTKFGVHGGRMTCLH